MKNKPKALSMDPIIEFKNVNFSYEKEKILENISFSIFPKEFIAIIGPNGGGKTTLLRLMLGLLRPQKGTLNALGHPIKKTPAHFSYVPQAKQFDKKFPISVFELVLMGRLKHLGLWGRYNKKDRDLVLENLEHIGLMKKKDAPFSSLSGGQLQRALIARALVSEPKVLLLDEPMSNVDTDTEQEIYKILNSLLNHVTILMVTHNLENAINQVNRVFCIQKHLNILNPKDVCEHFKMGLYQKSITKS